MEKKYIKQHKLLAMGVKLDGQKMTGGGKAGADTGSKGSKGDPKATAAIISKGKQNAWLSALFIDIRRYPLRPAL